MLKTQARILGVSIAPRTKSRVIIVGVVFRGNSWLDGLFASCLKWAKKDNELNLARAIMKSRQYSQLHAVILSQRQAAPGKNVDITSLSRRLKLPVIAISNSYRAPTKYGQYRAKLYDLQVNGKHLSVIASGVGPDRAQEIFDVGCKPNSHIPEAAKVAELILKQALW